MIFESLNLQLHDAGMTRITTGSPRVYYPPGTDILEISKEIARSLHHYGHCNQHLYGNWQIAGDRWPNGCNRTSKSSWMWLTELDDPAPPDEEKQAALIEEFSTQYYDGVCLPCVLEVAPKYQNNDFSPEGIAASDNPIMKNVETCRNGVKTYQEIDVRGWQYRARIAVQFFIWTPITWALSAPVKSVSLVPLALMGGLISLGVLSAAGTNVIRENLSQVVKRRKKRDER